MTTPKLAISVESTAWGIGLPIETTSSPGTKENWELVPHQIGWFSQSCTMVILEIASDGVLITASIDKARNLGVWDMQTKKLKSVDRTQAWCCFHCLCSWIQTSAERRFRPTLWYGINKGSKYPIMTIRASYLIGIRVSISNRHRAITADRKVFSVCGTSKIYSCKHCIRIVGRHNGSWRFSQKELWYHAGETV